MIITNNKTAIHLLREQYCYNQLSDIFQKHEQMMACYYDRNGEINAAEIHRNIGERMHDFDTAVKIIEDYLYTFEIDIDFDLHGGKDDVQMKTDCSVFYYFTILTFRDYKDLEAYYTAKRKILDLTNK